MNATQTALPPPSILKRDVVDSKNRGKETENIFCPAACSKVPDRHNLRHSSLSLFSAHYETDH